MRCTITVIAAGSAALGFLAHASRLTPPVLPLAVRNPYLSTWLSDARDPPWTEWPMFWTGSRVCRSQSCGLLLSVLTGLLGVDWLLRTGCGAR